MGAKVFWLALLCCLPLRSLRLTSAYGYRLHPVVHRIILHAGVDLSARSDTVFAVLDGVVNTCRYDPGLGLYIRISHAAQLETTFGHLSQWLVLPGDTVQAGQAVAISGATGITTGPHLHFAVTCQQHSIDPLRFLWRMINSNNHPSNSDFYEQTNEPTDRHKADRKDRRSAIAL
ncbi:MAG: M23 family metallopeptidase [Mucilaginibacter sp.]|nr:M23 family metallopeptidase [Mucilaginibacter sp.]